MQWVILGHQSRQRFHWVELWMSWAENSLPSEFPPRVGFLFFARDESTDGKGSRISLRSIWSQGMVLLSAYFWSARVYLCSAIPCGMKETWAGPRRLECLWGSAWSPGAASFDPWTGTGLVRGLGACNVSGSRLQGTLLGSLHSMSLYFINQSL